MSGPIKIPLTEAFGWNGTALVSKRMKEAVSESKKVARKYSSLTWSYKGHDNGKE
jgi:hypothetical protein